MTDFSFGAASLLGALMATMTAASLLEAMMLICFGLAWPAANLRMLRTRQSTGKGLAFTGLILIGYLAGAASKFALMSDGSPLAPLFWLYALNALSVAVNVALQWRYGTRPKRRSGLCARRRGRSVCLKALLAVGLCIPMTARTQTPGVVRPAADLRQRPVANPTLSEDRRFATAYGRFVLLADRGDAAAASAALFMLRHGRALFGSEWSATESQQAHWNALAVNAARYHLPIVSNGADD